MSWLAGSVLCGRYGQRVISDGCREPVGFGGDGDGQVVADIDFLRHGSVLQGHTAVGYLEDHTVLVDVDDSGVGFRGLYHYRSVAGLDVVVLCSGDVDGVAVDGHFCPAVIGIGSDGLCCHHDAVGAACGGKTCLG